MLGRKGEGEVPLGLRRDVTEKACSWVFVSGEPGHAGDKSICRLELVRAGDKGGDVRTQPCGSRDSVWG